MHGRWVREGVEDRGGRVGEWVGKRMQRHYDLAGYSSISANCLISNFSSLSMSLNLVLHFSNLFFISILSFPPP